jgi:hypothetical protein
MRPQQPVRRPAGTRQKPAETAKVILMYRPELAACHLACGLGLSGSSGRRAGEQESRSRRAGENAHRLSRQPEPTVILDLVLIGLAITLEPLPLTAFLLVLASERGVRKGAAFVFG